jgi:NAD-dependent SIR2 family protein deacetylase
MTDSQDQQLAAFVRKHPKLSVLTGAGCSTASGLGDYRDKAGQWKRKQPITGQLFIENDAARKRYWARSSVGWPSFSKAQPGAAHNALCTLEKAGHIELLITQNVDSLHQKAGHQNVIDLHGVLSTASCIECRFCMQRDDFQVELLTRNEWLNHLSAAHAPDGDADLEVKDLASMHVPPCPVCSGLLKPDVVFFGENVPRETVRQAMHSIDSSDALLVAGSSLMVYSGYRFCRQAHKLGKPIAIVNDGVTRADDLASLKITGDCGTRLMQLASTLHALSES